MPPEAAHGAAMAALRVGKPFLPAFARSLRCDDPKLAVTVAGLKFPNPIGLAEGLGLRVKALQDYHRV
jgi:dihydroorotate dehydrogenase